MKLNTVEKALMNNPLRTGLQRFYETPLFLRLGGPLTGQRVLEVGCGRGVGTQLLFKRFGAREVVAFDIDPDMVARARRRLAAYPPERLTLTVGDVTTIDAPTATFDAVIDFAIIHHVPDWPRAVTEIVRVLKPGGRFYFEEVTSQALQRWAYRTFLDHPRVNRFSAAQFITELNRQGITVGESVVSRGFGDFVIGVGRRDSAGRGEG